MARPLRIEYPGASYHVVNRGNQRQKAFYSPSHYELFLEKLGESCIKFNVTIQIRRPDIARADDRIPKLRRGGHIKDYRKNA